MQQHLAVGPSIRPSIELWGVQKRTSKEDVWWCQVTSLHLLCTRRLPCSDCGYAGGLSILWFLAAQYVCVWWVLMIMTCLGKVCFAL
jgi:hypothetical protein